MRLLLARKRSTRAPRAAPQPRRAAGRRTAVRLRVPGPGQPLPASLRAFFEPRFGRSLSRVRIHRGQAAAESARALGARAWTTGRHIVFGAGQWAPASTDGRRLLAHELAHTLQQGEGAPVLSAAAPRVLPSDHPSERQAEAASQAVLSGAAVVGRTLATGSSLPMPLVQRDVIDHAVRSRLTWKDYEAAAPAGHQHDAATHTGFVAPGRFSLQASIPEPWPTKAPAACRAGGGTTTRFRVGVTIDWNKYDVRAEMDTSRSWVKPGKKVASLLRHEQGHFDIAHVMGEKLEDGVESWAKANVGTAVACGADAARQAAITAFEQHKPRDAVDDLNKKAKTAYDKATADYEKQTGHGTDRAKQKSWEGEIAKGLPKYPIG